MTDLPNTPLPSPAQIMGWLDSAAGELDQLGKDIEAAHLALGEAEAEWTEALDLALLKVVEDHDGKRLPGEDVRLALSRKAMGFDIYRRYIIAKRQVEALEKHVRRLETAVNARQSTLKGMREGMAVNG